MHAHERDKRRHMVVLHRDVFQGGEEDEDDGAPLRLQHLQEEEEDSESDSSSSSSSLSSHESEGGEVVGAEEEEEEEEDVWSVRRFPELTLDEEKGRTLGHILERSAALFNRHIRNPGEEGLEDGETKVEVKADPDVKEEEEEEEEEEDSEDEEEEEEEEEVKPGLGLPNGYDWKLELYNGDLKPPEGEEEAEAEVKPDEFDSTIDPSLPLDQQVTLLLAESRNLRIKKHLMKEVLSYQLRIVSYQMGQLEQRDERSQELESEVKELKFKVTSLQDEILAMKSNQNLIGRHEQGTQTTSLVYPITITPRPPKMSPPIRRNSPTGDRGRSEEPGGPTPSLGTNAHTNAMAGAARSFGLGRGGGRGRGGSGSGSIRKFPKLPEPNNITHRTPPKYQYGHSHGQTKGQRIPFGSSSSPIKSPPKLRSPSPPKKVSDPESDGDGDADADADEADADDDGDDEDDEPDPPATRAHAHSSSNHNTHTHSHTKKVRTPAKISGAHRRSSASSTSTSTDSDSASGPRSRSPKARSSPRRRTHSGEKNSNSNSTTGRSKQASPTGLGRLSPRSPPMLRHSSPDGGPIRSPSPPKARATPPPPLRNPSPPPRQPSPPRGRLSSLRRTGKDKLYFTPMRSPSKSRFKKTKEQQQEPQQKTSTSTNSSTNSNSTAPALQKRPSTPTATGDDSEQRPSTRAKSKSPSPTRPKSIPLPVPREASSSPNIFSETSSGKSSPSNSMNKSTDDEYDNLFSQFRKYRPTPIIVRSAREVKLDGSVARGDAVVIKSSPLPLPLVSLRKEAVVKHSKSACVKLDRALTSNSIAKPSAPAPPPPQRPLDYDWRIPSRPIPFPTPVDTNKPGSSTALVKSALRRKRASPPSKDDLAKKIKMMRFSKAAKSEKDLRSYIAKKYQVKQEDRVKRELSFQSLKFNEEEEEEEELYDIDEYVEPSSAPPPKPWPFPSTSSTSTATFLTSFTLPKPKVTAPHAAALAAPMPVKVKAASTPKPFRSPVALQVPRGRGRPSNAELAERSSKLLLKEKEETPSTAIRPPKKSSKSPSPTRISPRKSPSPPRKRKSRVCWPPRAFTSRHHRVLLTDDPFYAMGSTCSEIRCPNGDDSDEEAVEIRKGRFHKEIEAILGPRGGGAKIKNEKEKQKEKEKKEAEKKKVEVPVPSWRVLKFEPIKSRPAAPLDEEMDDATYERRHAKWEVLERRRKRWDAQIQREEEYTRYLRDRQAQKEKRAMRRSYRTKGSHGLLGHNDLASLLPDPKKARYILIDDKLPVTAFGCAVPKLEKSVFKRPWKDRNAEDDDSGQEMDIVLPVITRPMRNLQRRLPMWTGTPAIVKRRKSSTHSSREQSPPAAPAPASAAGVDLPIPSTKDKKVRAELKKNAAAATDDTKCD